MVLVAEDRLAGVAGIGCGGKSWLLYMISVLLFVVQ